MQQTEKIYLESVNSCESKRLFYAVGQVGVVENDVEAKGLGTQCNGWAYAAETYNAERVSADTRAALRRLTHLLRPCELFALAHHVSQPEGASVQVEYQTQGCVGHLLHAVARHIAHCDAQFARGLNYKQIKALDFDFGNILLQKFHWLTVHYLQKMFFLSTITKNEKLNNRYFFNYLDINVVYSAADPHNDTQSFELLQIFLC